MIIVRCVGVSPNYKYPWPDGTVEVYDCIDFVAQGDRGFHEVRVGYGTRKAYGRKRARVVVWIDKHPHAEFLGADDFEVSGDVLSEIKIPDGNSLRICRYPEDSVPARYAGLTVCALSSRVQAPGLRKAWAVIANVADVRAMCTLALLRRSERI